MSTPNHARAKAAILILLNALFLITACSGAGETSLPASTPEPTVTRIPSTTPTFMAPPTAASLQSSTPTPRVNDFYYMIVLDASDAMRGRFDGSSQWDAARVTVEALLRGLEPGANFGLVLIGASSATEDMDLCNEPSVVRMPFTSQNSVFSQIVQLHPEGGGSSFAAFQLAMEQFNGLPPHAARVLIHISGSSDDCGRDEWRDLENLLQTRGAVDPRLHTEIIILDADEDFNGRALAARLSGLSRNVHAQSLESFDEIPGVTDAVIGNIASHIASIPTVTPPPTSTAFSTLTPVPVLSATATLSPTPTVNTLTPTSTLTPAPPTLTRTATLTATSTSTPTATPFQPPGVTLLSVNYLSSGAGCQIDVQVRVTGSDATGNFRVWNSSMPPDGEAYPQTTLQVGTNWASAFGVRNLLTLPGDSPASQRHEVWFEYNGVQSNRLRDLICPLPLP